MDFFSRLKHSQSVSALRTGVACLLFSSAISLGAHAAAPGYGKMDVFPDVQISPDGDHLAIGLMNNGMRQMIVVKTDSFETVGGANFGKTQEVGNFYWSCNNRLLIEVLQRDPWDDKSKYYGELYAVDADGKYGEMVFGYRAGEAQVGTKLRKNKDVFGWAKLVNPMLEDDKHVLISATPMPGGSRVFQDDKERSQLDMQEYEKQYSTVHRLNIRTGRMGQALARAPVANARYITNADDELIFAFGNDFGQAAQLFRYVNDDWQRISVPGGEFTPLTLDGESQRFYYLSQTGDDTALNVLDLASMQANTLHSAKGLTTDDVVFSSDYTRVYGVRDANAELGYQVFDDANDAEADLFKRFAATFEQQSVKIIGHSNDENRWIVYTNKDDTSGYYLYSASGNELSQIL
ncbi:hypothetical protein [Aestuariibacter salexigens]|uniref:hypothetical protein n=1 Tax=Aestuariibacter salexigens TaxID=226010 RepID=UPI000402A154|nr:hypothetical protein [Aestuariibacter salexigens]